MMGGLLIESLMILVFAYLLVIVNSNLTLPPSLTRVTRANAR